MRPTIANLSLIFALGLSATATAEEVPRGLAHWLLAAGNATQAWPEPFPRGPATFPSPPALPLVISDNIIDQLFATREPFAATDFPAPPAAPPLASSRWSGEYANQIVAAEEKPIRLPPPPAAEPNRVRFAAGAIAFAVPLDWIVAEADLSRHVRLYVTPDALPNGHNVMTDGVWISYHVEPWTGNVEAQLRAAMAQRLPAVLPSKAVADQPQFSRVAVRAALRLPFRLDADDDATGPAGEGYHQLIATEWGYVEIHARYTSSHSRAQIEQFINGLKIGEPEIADAQPTSEAAQAQAIVGSWKAEQARLVLSADGTVQLIRDCRHRRRLDPTNFDCTERTLQGEFTADGDLLRVTWADGSRLNLRWASRDGQLLLTDHLGRISQLARLLE